MGKKFMKIVALFLCCIAFNSISVKALEDTKERVILIDPGHGGIDGGAKSSSGTIEKDINLQISLKLKKALEEKGYKVFLTREEDKELNTKKVKDLDERCKMKRDTNCDIFISIHQNKFSKANCFGAQVWFADNEKSQKVANNIQESLKLKIDDNNKRVAKAAKKDYRILRDGYEGASIIVECGFLSNSKEEERLKSDEHQQKIAQGIVDGVDKYFAETKE